MEDKKAKKRSGVSKSPPVLKKKGKDEISDSFTDSETGCSQKSDTGESSQNSQASDKPTPSKLDKLNRDYFRPKTFIVETVTKRLDFEKVDEFKHIDELQVGLNLKDKLKFRVSRKNVLETKAGKILKFLGYDGFSEIEFVVFSQKADKESKLVEVNKVFTLKNFDVKEESLAYPSGSGNKFQIVLKWNSVMELTEDHDFAIIPFKFLTFKEVKDEIEVGQSVDIIGVMFDDDQEELAGEKIKRDIYLVDESGTSINVTLYEKKAQDFTLQVNQVVAFRNAKVAEFSAKKYINVGNYAGIFENISCPRASELIEWVKANPGN